MTKSAYIEYDPGTCTSSHVPSIPLCAVILFLYRKETELVLDLREDMTSNFKISKTLNSFDLEFNLENDFSKQQNHNASLSLSGEF